ncbi:hypothetical protein VIBNISOn1_560008 [Vibrio nigripulchritudo SOn1]|uniref:Integrase n=1 Tax=Vibrio nigripulchritudo SOn1 TaxID=1238450 RepID=A0AAV2VUV9_9VIBR|nr:hypothetical protein VIBNISOn1_560008 [Vibrio nigripulchritudo SOn1]
MYRIKNEKGDLVNSFVNKSRRRKANSLFYINLKLTELNYWIKKANNFGSKEHLLIGKTFCSLRKNKKIFDKITSLL